MPRGTYIENKSSLNEEKENAGCNQILNQWTSNNFCHPAHDDEQQQLLQQQHRYKAAATAAAALYFFFFFFSIPFIIFALLFSLPPINSRNSDPGSHSRLFSPPTHYGSCLAFLSRENFSSFFPRRLASNCAYPR